LNLERSFASALGKRARLLNERRGKGGTAHTKKITKKDEEMYVSIEKKRKTLKMFRGSRTSKFYEKPGKGPPLFSEEGRVRPEEKRTLHK